MTKILALVLLLACGALAAVSAARPASRDTQLAGKVGPGFSITLTQNGARVTHLDPGDYTITVDDESPEHDFHLAGKGVNEVTSVEGTGTETWHVTLTDDTYLFFCDVHAATMQGKFTVGSVTATTTTAAPAALKVHAAAKATGRVVSVRATATRPSSFDVSLLRGTKRVAHGTAKGTAATVKLKAPAAGRYVARVVAKAGASTAAASTSVTVR